MIFQGTQKIITYLEKLDAEPIEEEEEEESALDFSFEVRAIVNQSINQSIIMLELQPSVLGQIKTESSSK